MNNNFYIQVDNKCYTQKSSHQSNWNFTSLNLKKNSTVGHQKCLREVLRMSNQYNVRLRKFVFISNSFDISGSLRETELVNNTPG